MSDQTIRVQATLVRSSVRRGCTADDGQTLLFSEVVDATTGQMIRDHVWLPAGAWWPSPGTILRGDKVEFTVTIGPTLKGYLGERILDRDGNLMSAARIDQIGFHDPRDITVVKQAA